MATRLTNSRDILQSIIHFGGATQPTMSDNRYSREVPMWAHISYYYSVHLPLKFSKLSIILSHYYYYYIFIYSAPTADTPLQASRKNYVNEFLCRGNSIEMKLFWNYLSSFCSFFARKSCNRVDDDDDDDIKPPQLNQNN